MRYLLIIIAFFTYLLNADEIPQERLVDWSKAGTDNMPEFSHIIRVSSLGLDNSGKTDNATILNNAIDTAEKPVLFLFEPGIYIFGKAIKMKSNVCLSGYSSESTFFKFNKQENAFHGIAATGTAEAQFYDVEGGLTRGSNYLLTKSAALFNAKDYIELRENNGKWDSKPISWAKHSVGQILKIHRISEDTIFIDEKLRIDYSADLNPQIRLLKPIENCIIQYINLERIALPDKGVGYNILFSYAVNCSVSGVESNKSIGSHIMITLSKNIAVRGSYFHHAFVFDGSGTKGYGVTLNNHASDCLLENNIFKYLRHAMMVKHGANGNVFACNYSLEPHRSEPIANFSGDISLHGHYAYANLFESNIVQNIITDQYWGPSGPLNTFFRNRAELYGIISTSDKSNSMNYIGNETTNSSLLMGQFQIKGKNHYLYGNNILGKILPSGSKQPKQASIFYSGKPDYWDISSPFPAIGLPDNLAQNNIPAKYRYERRKKKTVGEYFPVSVADGSDEQIYITPNPATDYIDIAVAGNRTLKDAIRVYDVLGNTVLSSPACSAGTPSKGGHIRLDVSGLAPGVYFVRVGGKMYKFVKM